MGSAIGGSMRWLAIIALLLSFAVEGPGSLRAMDVVHTDELSTADFPSEDAPARTAGLNHLSCGHSHLMDRAHYVQAGSPPVINAARLPLSSALAFESSIPNPPDKPPRA